MYHQTSRRVIRDVETERRFDSALSCVRRGGAPLNPLIRDQVREIAEEVVSGGDVIICAASAVVPLAKSDPILYGALCRILHSTGESPAFGKLPLEQLSDLRPSVCGQVLLSAASTHSKYRFAAAGPSQLGATRYVVAATAAAEAFGPRCLAAVPPESAFLATYLRTVGHIFLAWGYASVYPRLFRANRADPTELERALRRTLGMGPLGYAGQLVNDWQLERSLTRGFESTPRPTSQADFESALRFNPLSAISLVSEMYARSQDKVLFPTGRRDWELFAEFAEAGFESGALAACIPQLDDIVRERVEWSERARLASRVRIAEQTRPNSVVVPQVSSNPYLTRLPEDIQADLLSLYQSREIAMSYEQIASTLRSVLFRAGFSDGTIELSEPETNTPLQEISLGVPGVGGNKALALLRRVADVARASEVPLVSPGPTDSRSGEERRDFACISASFSNDSIAGVLLVQAPSASVPAETMLCFKAVRQCLADCLRASAPSK